jgi:hypothetical protein
MRRWLGIVSGIALIVAALLGGGCASLGAGDNSGFGMVAKDRVPFYTTGPGESVPDRYLEYGTRMRSAGSATQGYIRVQLVSGETGFVRASDVSDAPDPTANP